MCVLGSMRYQVREGRQLTGVPKHQEEGEHRCEPPRRRQHAREVSHWATGYLSLSLVSRNWRRQQKLAAASLVSLIRARTPNTLALLSLLAVVFLPVHVRRLGIGH